MLDNAPHISEKTTPPCRRGLSESSSSNSHSRAASRALSYERFFCHSLVASATSPQNGNDRPSCSSRTKTGTRVCRGNCTMRRLHLARLCQDPASDPLGKVDWLSMCEVEASPINDIVNPYRFWVILIVGREQPTWRSSQVTAAFGSDFFGSNARGRLLGIREVVNERIRKFLTMRITRGSPSTTSRCKAGKSKCFSRSLRSPARAAVAPAGMARTSRREDGREGPKKILWMPPWEFEAEREAPEVVLRVPENSQGEVLKTDAIQP
jgi:hypothetical protein